MALRQRREEAVIGDVMRVQHIGIDSFEQTVKPGPSISSSRGQPKQAWKPLSRSGRSAASAGGHRRCTRVHELNLNAGDRFGLGLIESQQGDVKVALGEMTRPAPHVDAVGVADQADLRGSLHRPWAGVKTLTT